MLAKYGFSVAKSVAEIRNKIKNVNPDLVHCNTVRAGIVTTIATIGMNIPVIWHVHDILHNHAISSIIRRLAFQMRYTHAVCVSAATAKAFCGPLNFGERVTVIHNGVDLSKFPRRLSKEARLSEELRINPEHFLVSTIGQIAPRKNLGGLISAFVTVRKSVPTAHLAIVGDAIFNEDFKYRDKLIAQTKELGIDANVHFTGPRKDIDSVIRSSDLVVLNSIEEPFGLVLVEAMSSGTAVLASAVGGVPEIVTDGVSGFLVASEDDVSLASKLLELISDPTRRSGIENRAFAEVCPKYSLSRFVQSIHGYYRQVVTQAFVPRDAVEPRPHTSS
jgi:glycosyltransferase involved in cell wall biosynthesis